MGIIQRQGIKNAALSYVGILLGFLSLLIIQPHFLKPEEIGLTRVLFSFSFLVSTLSTLGIGNITTRFFPHFKNQNERHSGFLGLVLIFPIVGTLITGLFLVLFAHSIQHLYAEKSALFNEFYFWSIPYSFLIAITASVSVYCNALFKSTFPSLMNEVVNRFLFIALILIYAAGFFDLKTFVALYVSIHLIQLVALFGYLMKVDVPSIKVSKSIINRQTLAPMISYGLLLLFAGTASMGIKLLDTIVLGQFVTLDLVGVYAVVAFIPTFIEAPLNALDKIASPKIASALVHNDKKQILEIYSKSSRYLFAFGALMVLLLVFNIDALLTFLPERFALGRNVILILSISALFNLITGSNNAIVFNSEKFYIGSAVLVLISLITLALLYAFIPEWGLEGAALAICVSSILYNTFKYVFIFIKFGIQPFDFKTALILMNLAITGVLGYFIQLQLSPLLSIIVHGLLIASIYGLLTYYTRVLSDLNFKNILG